MTNRTRREMTEIEIERRIETERGKETEIERGIETERGIGRAEEPHVIRHHQDGTELEAGEGQGPGVLVVPVVRSCHSLRKLLSWQRRRRRRERRASERKRNMRRNYVNAA